MRRSAMRLVAGTQIRDWVAFSSPAIATWAQLANVIVPSLQHFQFEIA
jgi:hypothetical protein